MVYLTWKEKQVIPHTLLIQGPGCAFSPLLLVLYKAGIETKTRIKPVRVQLDAQPLGRKGKHRTPGILCVDDIVILKDNSRAMQLHAHRYLWSESHGKFGLNFSTRKWVTAFNDSAIDAPPSKHDQIGAVYECPYACA